MKIFYWVSTTLLSVAALASAWSYFSHQATIEGVRELGFPDYFRLQLGVMKILAAVAIIAPFVPVRIKEWAYVGLGLFVVTAIVAHTAHRDPVALTVLNVALLVLLITSNMALYAVDNA